LNGTQDWIAQEVAGEGIDVIEIKQSTLQEIIETEQRLTLAARERYADHYALVETATAFLSLFVTSVPPTLPVFARFWSLSKKHHLLALLSTVRLHHIQAMLDLRQSLEAAVCAAFAIVHTDPALFADTKNGILESTKALSTKRYRWLDKNFPEASQYIKEHKDRINSSSAHANIVYTHQIFEHGEREFNLPFFDNEDPYHVQTDLYTVGTTAISLMNLFYGVNDKNGKPLHFVPNFESRLLSLDAQFKALQAKMLADPRTVEIARRIAAESSNNAP
jgi:hypothetical protein